MARPADDRSATRIGRPASGGRFNGPAFRRLRQAVIDQSPERPEIEAARLAAALNRAAADLRRLADQAGDEGAAILDFQLEMLSDPDLLTEVHRAIAEGVAASSAWSAEIDRAIAGFLDTGDEALVARIPDLSDVRDRVLAAIAGTVPGDFPKGHVFLGTDLEPSLFLAHDWGKGGAVILSDGSAASHVAILARARGVPMLVAADIDGISPGDRLDIDGDRGLFSVNRPMALTAADCTADEAGLADHWPPRFRLQDGSVLTVDVNVAEQSDLRRLEPGSFAAVGLVRSEFLFPDVADRLDAARQAQAYLALAAAARGKPLTVRLFDLGGDKGGQPGRRFDPPHRRGLRYLFAHPDLIEAQLRALIRAADKAPLAIMAPMVTVPSEMAALRRLAAALAAEEGLPLPPIGMMVETPAAALTFSAFDADFASIGSNDLAQFVAATGRGLDVEQDLVAESRPALMRLIGDLAAEASRIGRPLSICGDLAGDAEALPALLAAGIRRISVAPARLARIKEVLAQSGFEPMREDGDGA